MNFGLLAAEIDPVVWGTPTNFNGFRVLADVPLRNYSLTHSLTHSRYCTAL